MAADVTGGTPPTNASPFAVPADIKAVYDHFGDQTNFSRATAGSLPASGNYVGRRLLAEDTKLWYTCTALPGTWVQDALMADSGWVTLSTFGTGWSATASHTPRIRKVGSRVEIAGAVTLGSGGSYANILTIPVGYRLGGAYTNYFIGGVTAQNGAPHQLFLSGTDHRLAVPSTYRGTAMTTSDVLPLTGSWFID